jgi:predicted TIM-barrel fold metal-dependent hydrolase
MWDPFWEKAIELGMPLSFHILSSRDVHTRGPKMNHFMSIIRGNQDIMGTLIFGGVFERFPELKVVCVEADAGWVPHYMYRMDHAYNRHRAWLHRGQELAKLPSEYFAEHIYLTFQDDWIAFRDADAMNWRRLMWANDFPHSDSTWPNSQELIAEHAKDLRPEQREAILCGNVAELYGIDVGKLAAAA